MDLLLTDARIATMADDDYGVIEGGAVAIEDGRITWIGPASDAPSGESAAVQSLDGRWITPALIDCHTHLVFAGDRSGEFEQRLRGDDDAGGTIAALRRLLGDQRALQRARSVAVAKPFMAAARMLSRRQLIAGIMSAKIFSEPRMLSTVSNSGSLSSWLSLL